MCYGMGCKYEYPSGDCRIICEQKTDIMPDDAACMKDYEEEEECKENTGK